MAHHRASPSPCWGTEGVGSYEGSDVGAAVGPKVIEDDKVVCRANDASGAAINPVFSVPTGSKQACFCALHASGALASQASHGISERGLGGVETLSRRHSRYSDSEPHNTFLSIMALAQDANSENQQMSNSPGPSASGRNTQGSPSQIRVEVTVLRAHNIPYIKRSFDRKRQFSVTVTDLVTTKKTKSVQIEGHTVQWNQPLGTFSTQRSSHFTLVLYEKRLAHRNTVIGTCEIPIPDATRSDVSFDLINGDGGAVRSTQ
ncbi:hypothetical protein EDB85DRAFT_2275539, partial [Lactarius pseudohatsudake]